MIKVSKINGRSCTFIRGLNHWDHMKKFPCIRESEYHKAVLITTLYLMPWIWDFNVGLQLIANGTEWIFFFQWHVEAWFIPAMAGCIRSNLWCTANGRRTDYRIFQAFVWLAESWEPEKWCQSWVGWQMSRGLLPNWLRLLICIFHCFTNDSIILTIIKIKFLWFLHNVSKAAVDAENEW